MGNSIIKCVNSKRRAPNAVTWAEHHSSRQRVNLRFSSSQRWDLKLVPRSPLGSTGKVSAWDTQPLEGERPAIANLLC